METNSDMLSRFPVAFEILGLGTFYYLEGS